MRCDLAPASTAATEGRAGYVAEGILKETFREADRTYADEKVFGLLKQQWAVAKPLLLAAMQHPREPFPEESTC